MLRYPGSKEKLKTQIIDPIICFYENTKGSIEYEYREPFFGGGSIGLELVKKNIFKYIWINDKDYSLCCFWNSVLKNPDGIIDNIKDYTPSSLNFNEIKKFLIEQNFENFKEEEVGAKKLIIHRTSFSGLGTMAGPLGGNEQTGKYKNDARWNTKRLIEDIRNTNSYFKTKELRNGCCTNLDYRELLLDNSKKWFTYLDPPYYVMGDALYSVKFTEKDHKELAEILKNTEGDWLLSYDDCQEIRSLYDWANFIDIDVSYSISGVKKKTEVLIYPKKLQFIFDINNRIKTSNIF